MLKTPEVLCRFAIHGISHKIRNGGIKFSNIPRWSFPVTLGGGITIINISLSFFFTASPMDPQLYSGLKNPETKYWRIYKNI